MITECKVELVYRAGSVNTWRVLHGNRSIGLVHQDTEAVIAGNEQLDPLWSWQSLVDNPDLRHDLTDGFGPNNVHARRFDSPGDAMTECVRNVIHWYIKHLRKQEDLLRTDILVGRWEL